MASHECDKKDDLDELKEKVSTLGSRMIGLMIISGIFIFLVGVSATQATKAKDSSDRFGTKVEIMRSRIDVQEERLKWILDGIQRIEKKLEKQEKKP